MAACLAASAGVTQASSECRRRSIDEKVADATHPVIINRVVAQHNARILCTLPNGTFGRRANWVNIIVNECDYETGFGTLPAISRMQYGVFDPDSRFRGNVTHLQGCPGNWKCHFPVLGGTNLVIRALGEKF